MARRIEGREMDGRFEAYVPEEPLRIDGSLSIWDEPLPEVDPITFEVIRHNLWHINEEHGETIVKVSGSPIAVFGQDFNPCLMDERGDYVFFGPYYQVHSGMQDLTVKWILENRSSNPGISDGDMWLHNDPWVGTTHQSDAATMCPVFVDGRLFCWVGNTLHFVDVGGPTPGGWCPDARTVWDEPPISPPMKVVENGKLRRDIEEEWVRRSRIPELVALDLRAVIAGNNVARSRILALVERYGASTVKAVMRKTVDDAENRFVEQLGLIPNGTWTARNYLEVAGPGDRGAYQCVLTLEKRGETLTFSNAGTHPAVGSLNLTYAGWRGAILAAVGPLLCYDSLFAVGGAVRHCEFKPTPGSILSASHPSAVSNGGAIGALCTIALANVCIAGMMGCDPELKHELTAPTGLSQWPVTALYGRDQRGRDFSTVILDWYLGTMGAQAWRDGVHTGGVYWGPYHIAPNVEQVEQTSPVLYLQRGELVDGQGLGRYSSGAGPTASWTPHRTDQITLNIATCGMAVPTGPGIFGGMPGVTNSLRIRRQGGEAVDLRPKEKDVVLEPGDVYEGWSSGGAGYGDPLLRDPELVADDVRERYVTGETAERFYGVRLEAGAVQPEETALLRDRLRAERLGYVPSSTGAILEESDVLFRVGDSLAVIDAEQPLFVCARCGARLGHASDGFKAGAVRRAVPVEACGPLFGSPTRFVDREFELRLFLCGECGTLLETEVSAVDDESLEPVKLALVRDDVQLGTATR
jgi:N-methylhydantoinase B